MKIEVGHSFKQGKLRKYPSSATPPTHNSQTLNVFFVKVEQKTNLMKTQKNPGQLVTPSKRQKRIAKPPAPAKNQNVIPEPAVAAKKLNHKFRRKYATFFRKTLAKNGLSQGLSSISLNI